MEIHRLQHSLLRANQGLSATSVSGEPHFHRDHNAYRAGPRQERSLFTGDNRAYVFFLPFEGQLFSEGRRLYDFNKDLYDFTQQLNDGHTR